MITMSLNQEVLDEKMDEKDKKIKELQEKLNETEKKLNELNRNLEKRVIERTVEINKLLLHKNKFIDNLSHDIGTPLTPLTSLLPIIKEEVSNPKTKELVDTCIRSAEYIKRVVQNTRKLAELNFIDFYLKRENLSKIVKNLVNRYDVVFKSSNIIVENNIDENIYVQTEESRLLDVLDHISSNAVNSMPNGGKIIFDAEKIKKENKEFVKISIRDTGIGLSRDQMDHIFDEFYKADESRHKLDSTGLGLSICKRIVEKHGGHIWADSHGPNSGTTIYFTIPAA